MTLRNHKGKIAIGLVLLALIVMIFGSGPARSREVRTRFLYTTNDSAVGRVAIFEVVNDLGETVQSGFGHYKPATRNGLSAEKGDWGAPLGNMQTFPAHSTNTVQVWSPTNGGPYKLVLYCVPVSKTTPQFQRSVRFRMANFISRLVHPSLATQARWYGALFVESQPFEVQANTMQ
jgi:hypothetical protein